MTKKQKAVLPSQVGAPEETATSPRQYVKLPALLNKGITPHNSSAQSQRARLLRYLKEVGPITTLQARHLLDICHPGTRVCELRKFGFPIETIWVNDLTLEGNTHRVARYVLRQKSRQFTLLTLSQNTAQQEG